MNAGLRCLLVPNKYLLKRFSVNVQKNCVFYQGLEVMKKNISAVENPSRKMAGYFALLTSLFFIWGFLTVMNDILVPFFKKSFDLSYFQSNLVQLAFFLAYSVGGLVYFLISMTQGDPIARIGYKYGIVIGLFVSAFGAFLFIPAAAMVSYPMFLLALFVLALGFTLLQISSNPYVAILGSESSASSRLNLSQGFNSLGTMLAPIIGGFLIFNYFGAAPGVSATSGPYLVFALVLCALGIVFWLIPLPRVEGEDAHLVESKPVALKFPQLRGGMAAIFFYVGSEVAVGTMLINFLGLPEILGLAEEEAGIFVGIYWGGLMVGRFLGAISLNQSTDPKIRVGGMLLTAAICCAAIFGVIFLNEYVLEPWISGVFSAPGFSWDGYWAQAWQAFDIMGYAPFFLLVGLNWLAFLAGKSLPARTLMIFAGICLGLLLTGILSEGKSAAWAIIGVGLFNSIMWSNIFTMAIEGLGKYKSQGSSLLVTMIIGGATLPPLQGLVADQTGSIQWSFLIPALGYIYLGWYGWAWPRLMRKDIFSD